MGVAKTDRGGEGSSHQSLPESEVSNLEDEFQDEPGDLLWTPSDAQLLALVFIVSMAASFLIFGLYLAAKKERER
jgi:hypothetical protein